MEEEKKSYFKAFIRVVKSIAGDDGYYSFGPTNIVEERLIEAKDKKEVKEFLLQKYPQFFQNGKLYEKETKDQAQFFYVVIFPLYNSEVEQVEGGAWTCSYCGHIHDNEYISRPRRYDRLFGGLMFCRSEDDYCLEQYKKEYYKDVELPDDENYIKPGCPIFIYRITEKSSNKSYVGKTKNAPFFRWWNHLKHSSSPFGLYLRNETKLSDWTFEVLKELPGETDNAEVLRIESEFIHFYDSINNGYNTVISNKKAIKNGGEEDL